MKWKTTNNYSGDWVKVIGLSKVAFNFLWYILFRLLTDRCCSSATFTSVNDPSACSTSVLFEKHLLRSSEVHSAEL